ncbi:ABC transporter transmembrane domain-containing protein [Nubsella zeaxanthinifaciens]|jgi:ABC-type bacteriocin/lantibiotic exporter with double-glycine peptidase domain|uniref:ABC transporter transmembrane domain-containing protein n=1 Tax=Nubsella zeaxanthinifaciens TaxID=392412 RepID=UPI000DE40FC3|nr:ABC transporter transmembrane domain-containing protein [Nubsella zeaxanthinifaciens]
MKKKHAESALKPWQRLVAILHFERSSINYILFYAILIGLLGLSLPLGTTAIFNLLSNGSMYSSTYILIAVVLLGILIGGLLLIGQLTLVELVEQKIFARTSLEFAYRLPRIKKSELEGEHPPELVNRFFGILTIQKGLTKLVVEIVAAAVLIVFSAILLSFYHPVYMAFGIFIMIALPFVVALYYKEAVKTSLKESSHKYQVVAYLEEVAGNLDSYRGNEAKMKEAMDITDEITSNYLKSRTNHFRILRKFFASSIIIRTILMGALLVMGSYFVIERQMTFGQFVAAEVIVVQISYAVEKIMTSMNTIFDMVTAAEKLAVVTDLDLNEGEEANHG